jgi:hypothetical protein
MGIASIRADSDLATHNLCKTPLKRSAVRQENSVEQLLYFSMNTVADMTAVPLSAHKKLARFLCGLGFNTPLFETRHLHSGMECLQLWLHVASKHWNLCAESVVEFGF